MSFLKTLLGFLIVILIVIVGAGFYLTSGMQHENMNMGNTTTSNQQQNDQNQAPSKVNQKVTIVLEPDLRNYIDDINKGITLLNEANGLITMDPFFSNPPKVTAGKLQTTPFDKLLPKDRNNPIIVFPDGTYQTILDTGNDQRNTYRGIYKLGQGMTVLNSVLDRMNSDINTNNFPTRNPNTAGVSNNVINPNNNYSGTMSSYGYANPHYNMMAGYPNMAGMYPNNMYMTNTMPGMTDSTMQGMSSAMSIFNSGTISTILYIIIFIFGILAIISAFGYIYNYIRGPKYEPEV